MLTKLNKAPFPYAGGKRHAADKIWAALGDVRHYVEPFMGSLAVLLERPHQPNRTYYSETVNDVDGLLVNAWRSIQLSPEETAVHASWPVSEADIHARHIALLRWKEEQNLEILMGDPLWHNPTLGGWWIWGASCWLSAGWCVGNGSWWSDGPGAGGRIYKRGKPQLREPGVKRQKPQLSASGRGINHPGTREPGVEFHAVTMPEARRWLNFLSARLRHVRIVNGDWSRVCTKSVVKILSVDRKHPAGVFLDPPYGADGVCDVYAHDSNSVANEASKWCAKWGAQPWLRIVLAGFDGEHNGLEELGWTKIEWYKGGFLRGGYKNTAGTGATQMDRDRLWLSPHCIQPEAVRQIDLFGAQLDATL